jgi:hypothetical protein
MALKLILIVSIPAAAINMEKDLKISAIAINTAVVTRNFVFILFFIFLPPVFILFDFQGAN